MAAGKESSFGQNAWRGVHGLAFLAMFGLSRELSFAHAWPWFWITPLVVRRKPGTITTRA
jgi:hypothetical protein